MWVNPNCFEEPRADALEKMRDKLRRRYHQITYDCHQASVTPRGVLCARAEGPMDTAKVLRGWSWQRCHTCEAFDGGE